MPRRRWGLAVLLANACVVCPRSFFSLFGGDEEVSEKVRSRFFTAAEGQGQAARIRRPGLQSLLECTDSFCLTKRWLDEDTLDRVYSQYANDDGIDLQQFGRLADDGLLLEGKLDEYEKAFNGVDKSGTGVISSEELWELFSGLGRAVSKEELARIIDEADVDHDGIDFADFLGLARTHLDLAQVIRYLETTPERPSSHDSVAEGILEHVTTVHSESELYSLVGKDDAVVKLAFTWCKPCKAFLPRYEKFAKVYKTTRFLKIVGNENESCKHYAKEVLRAKISPMFAAYCKGKLVKTWHGANNLRFTTNLEEVLPSAQSFAQEREAAQDADPSLRPS